MDDDRDGALDASSSHFRAAASAGSSREETGNRIMRRGEAALARTRLEVSEWNLALFDAKQHLVAANKEFSSGPAQLFKDKKPELADLARRIKVFEKQVETKLFDDEERHQGLIEGGDYSAFVASMEEGWLLRQELHGKGSCEVKEHVEELVLMLNNVAMHLVNMMAPEGNDASAKLAYDYLDRAFVLTNDDNSDAVLDVQTRKRLRAISFNNMGCYYERRNKLLKSLEFLDRALRLELDVQLVEDPSATHLNLCRVLSRLKRHDAAFQHARCAIEILEDSLLTLNGEWEEEKSWSPPTLPPTPTFAGTTPPPPTTAGTLGDTIKRFNRDVSTAERIKDAIGKFAVANHSAACELEHAQRFADSLGFHRKAAEGARQAFGCDYHLTIRFQEDLAACSKVSHRHHSKKKAPQSRRSESAVEGHIPYGLGLVAGPETIVAGWRGGTRFGFSTVSHRPGTSSQAHSADSTRIALGLYAVEELQAMFGTSRSQTSIGSYETYTDAQDNPNASNTNAENTENRPDSEVDETETDSQYDDLRDIIAEASLQKKNLVPMVLEGEDGIEGFWVDKRSNTAYHVSRIGPVHPAETEPAAPTTRGWGASPTGGHAHPKRWQPGNLSQSKSTLEADEMRGGELPPMDPRRALEPERMKHLENLAKFLYEKVGPLPEAMVRVRLRVFDAPHWEKWRQEQRDHTWAEAKQMIRAATAEKSKGEGGVEGERESQVGDSLPKGNVDFEILDEALGARMEQISTPWQDSRMLLVPLSIGFSELKEKIAAEFGLEAGSIEILAKDQEEEDYFSVASEQGLRSVFASCPGSSKSCQLFCSGAVPDGDATIIETPNEEAKKSSEIQ